jgi:hypothetical protein
MHFSGARNIGIALLLAALGAPGPPTFNLFSSAPYHLVSMRRGFRRKRRSAAPTTIPRYIFQRSKCVDSLVFDCNSAPRIMPENSPSLGSDD